MQIDLSKQNQFFKIENTIDLVPVIRNVKSVEVQLGPDFSEKMQRKGSTDTDNSTLCTSIMFNSDENFTDLITEPKTLTDIMHERWEKANSQIPKIDKSDIFDNTHFSTSDQEAFAVRQSQPEYSQSSYLRIRSLEQAFPICNYFKTQKDSKVSHLTSDNRALAVHKITELHAAKEYMNETLFTAIGILDHYLMIKGLDQFDP